MKPKTSEVGGGSAQGLGDDLVSAFRSLLSGQPNSAQRYNQADPTGKTEGIMGALSDLLSPGGGTTGGGIRSIIETKQKSDVADLRARFGAAGGASFGTPAAYAESQYRAQAAPQAAVATGSLQLQTLATLLPLLTSLAGRGISQRTSTISPSDFTQITSGAAGLLEGASGFYKPKAA